MSSPKLLTFTVMKNEAPFILEWVAHQRMLGVDKTLVLTNDCDDGTDALLDRLEDLGFVHHLPNPFALGARHIKPIARPHMTGIAYARLTRHWREADYIFLLDVDEFPMIRTGNGTLKALLEETDHPDVITISERLFGTGDILRYEDKPLTGSFLMSDSSNPTTERFARRGVKSLVRNCPSLDVRNHRPLPARHLDEKQVAALRWIDGSGHSYPMEERVELKKGNDSRGRTDLAEVFHYSLRSLDSYLVKRERGDAVKIDRPRREMNYYRSRDRTSERCDEMLSKQDALLTQVATLKADPVVRDLHEQAVEWHKAKAQTVRKTEYGKELEAIARTRAKRMRDQQLAKT